MHEVELVNDKDEVVGAATIRRTRFGAQIDLYPDDGPEHTLSPNASQFENPGSQAGVSGGGDITSSPNGILVSTQHGVFTIPLESYNAVLVKEGLRPLHPMTAQEALSRGLLTRSRLGPRLEKIMKSL